LRADGLGLVSGAAVEAAQDVLVIIFYYYALPWRWWKFWIEVDLSLVVIFTPASIK
jgi:hypothetical protein